MRGTVGARSHHIKHIEQDHPECCYYCIFDDAYYFKQSVSYLKLCRYTTCCFIDIILRLLGAANCLYFFQCIVLSTNGGEDEASII